MSEFIWQDHYKTGYAKIDAEHQHLFELANRIIQDNCTEELTLLFMLFYQHVREHFKAEEELMKQHHYPSYLVHVDAHNIMLEQLNDISEIIQNKQWRPSDIQAFIDYWVLTHILEADMLVADFLHQCGEPPAFNH